MGSSQSKYPAASTAAAAGNGAPGELPHFSASLNFAKTAASTGNGNAAPGTHVGPTPAPPQPTNNNDKQHPIYQLVDMHGGGELIKWMRYARKGGDYSILDGYLDTTVRNTMYNGGKGKLESVSKLVKMRNKERNDRLSAFSRKKGKGKSGPNILDDFNQEMNQGDLKKALKLLGWSF